MSLRTLEKSSDPHFDIAARRYFCPAARPDSGLTLAPAPPNVRLFFLDREHSMLSTDRYQVDPDEVDGVVRTMFGHIDEFSGLCRQFGDLVPPVRAFGLIASPAAVAAM